MVTPEWAPNVIISLIMGGRFMLGFLMNRSMLSAIKETNIILAGKVIPLLEGIPCSHHLARAPFTACQQVGSQRNRLRGILGDIQY